MPYSEEDAAKLTHSWAAGKAELFAKKCEPLCLPEAEQIQKTVAMMQPVNLDHTHDDSIAHAIDGSCIEIPMAGGLPGASAMAVAVGGLNFSRADLRNSSTNTGVVDPFALAGLLASGESIGFLLPSRDLSYQKKSICDGWALALDEVLFTEKWNNINLSDTLAFLSTIDKWTHTPDLFVAALQEFNAGLNNNDRNFQLICPICGETTLALITEPDPKGTKCSKKGCNTPLWACDSLGVRANFRLDGKSATLHAMLGLEKLFAAAVLLSHGMSTNEHGTKHPRRTIYLDGPLGHGALAKELKSLLIALRTGPNAFNRPWLVGIQKTGMLPKLAALVGSHAEHDVLYAKADDAFLKEAFGPHHTSAKRIAMEGAIGEPYILTANGKGYALWLPEGADKINKGEEVHHAMSMAATMACWLYDNASLPNALAHRISSISVKPGRDAISKIGAEMMNQHLPSKNGSLKY